MNMTGRIIAILIASTTWGVTHSSKSSPAHTTVAHVRSSGAGKKSTKEQGITASSEKQLMAGKSCSLEGETRQPGQWLQGQKRTCQCDRNGSGKLVACVTTMAASSASSEPNLDENTALGRRQQFSNNNDFVFDLLGSMPEHITPAGTIQPLGVAEMPALAGEGVSYSLFHIEPCGINLPHTHPRATELLYVISGKDLRTAFVEENGGRVIVNDIGTGEATFFPEGLMHYQQNLSCETAMYLSALNSEDPGVITHSTQFFQFPNEALQATLGQGETKVQVLVDGLPDGPAEGHKACMRACGLEGTSGGLRAGAL